MLTESQGRFGNYDYRELVHAKSKRDFVDILTQAKVSTSGESEPASHPSTTGGRQRHRSASQALFNARVVDHPLPGTDLPIKSRSHQDTSFSVELLPVNRTNRLVRLILDDGKMKSDILAREFLDLTEAQFQDILDKAAAILRERKIDNTPYMNGCAMLAIGIAIAFAMYFASFNLTGLIPFEGTMSLILMGIGMYFVAGFGSTGMMYANGCIDASVAVKSKGKKIRELRDQFQTFCTSVRESGLRQACCSDIACSIPKKESIIKFATYAGLTGAVVVGGGLVGVAPFLDALASGFGSNGFWGNIVEIASGNPISQQAQDVLWWIHFVGTYACELGVPLVFLASIFSGLKHDFMEFCYGAKQRNERVQDTVNNLRALLAKFDRDQNYTEFVEGLMHQKRVESSELMIMDCISKEGLNADALETRGLTQNKLEEHDLKKADLAVFCSDAKKVMEDLPDREISPDEALELVNSLRFDVTFRNKVLNGLKFKDATYNDGWVRFVGGARTVVRLGLAWLSMNSLSGTFASPMIVSHYRSEAGIASNVTLTCALFANKTIKPFNAVTFHTGVASYASQGISLSDAEVGTLDAGWMMIMMSYSSITEGTRIFPKLNAESVCGKVKEGFKETWKEIVATIAGGSGALMYIYIAHLSGGKNDDAIMLLECPYLSDVPNSPIVYEYRGSNNVSLGCLFSILNLASIKAWYYFLDKIEVIVKARRRVRARAAQQQDVERQQMAAASLPTRTPAPSQQASSPSSSESVPLLELTTTESLPRSRAAESGRQEAQSGLVMIPEAHQEAVDPVS